MTEDPHENRSVGGGGGAPPPTPLIPKLDGVKQLFATIRTKAVSRAAIALLAVGSIGFALCVASVARSQQVTGDLQEMRYLRGINNYDNDPDLARAMRFDSEQNGHDKDAANQARAEAYYLKFLERAPDTYRRVAVYTQLGVLFSTSFQPEKGEKRDLAKAGAYFARAIEEAGDRVSRAAIRARLNRTTPNLPPEQRIRMRIDLFELLEEIGNLDHADLQGRWLTPPGFAPPTITETTRFQDLTVNFRDTTAWNMTGEAFLTDDPVKYLNMIKERLPGTRAAEMADRRLAQRKDAIDQRVQQETESVLQNLDEFAPLEDEPPWTDDAAPTGVDPAGTSNPTQQPRTLDGPEHEPSDSRPHAVYIGVAALLLTVIAISVARSRAGRQQTPAQNRVD